MAPARRRSTASGTVSASGGHGNLGQEMRRLTMPCSLPEQLGGEERAGTLHAPRRNPARAPEPAPVARPAEVLVRGPGAWR